jgi:glycerol uptake facilitator-like aquaporin
MTPFIAEIIGTMLMILGKGEVTNVVLTGTKETIQDGLLLQQDGHLPFLLA